LAAAICRSKPKKPPEMTEKGEFVPQSVAGDSPAEPAKFDAVAEAKLLLRVTRSAALATLVPDTRQPFATLVNVATAPDAGPILLLSELAAHRRHLSADPRLSLLFYAPGRGDPLAHPRLTILGRARRIDDAERRAALRARFLAYHPKSALYADFPDFAFFLVEMESVHLNGGFGRAALLTAPQIHANIDAASEVVAAEAGAIAHINADHPDVPDLLAAAFGAPANIERGIGSWRAIGLDPEGLDLGNDAAIVRIAFPHPVSTVTELRQVLVDLAAAARQLPKAR
jgi:putative heme iron utilization protein